ncbi:MAG: cytochrome c-type biogenesis protein CcmH [Terracidiphilus sp.]
MDRRLWTKAAQALLVAVAVCFSVGATDAGSRYTNLNHRLMCTCGCAEILGECNHVGCTNSTKELADLRALIASNKSDQDILDTFAANYGATVLAAPPTRGFDLVAWIAPFAVFVAAMLGTVLLIRRWTVPRRATQPVDAVAGQPAGTAADPSPDPTTDALRQKIRRETGADGEF